SGSLFRSFWFMAWPASSFSRSAKRVSAVAAAILLLGPCTGRSRAADEPYGLLKRVPWNSTRLKGSPEPPPPYPVEKTFNKQRWKSPIYIAAEPGTDRLWIVLPEGGSDQGSQIVRIKDDPAALESTVVLDIPKRLIYSVCFHPGYTANGFVYIFSNGPR